ncbi:MAG TPA: hypothetical protein VGE52_06970, partial [Pirellulales bacterium]
MRTYLAAAMLAAPLWAASGWLAAPAGLNAAEGDPVAKVEPQPVLAATESTLKSDGDRIRALAFDG